MPDIRIVSIASPDVVTMDWLQTPTGLLDETQQLADAIIVALNSDALADTSDVLPDPRDDNRRGWWGDTDAATIWNGWPLGSKLWLLTREKIVDNNARAGATTTRAQMYIQQALQPFIDNKICSNVVVNVTQLDSERIQASITIYRGPKTAIQLQYQQVWQELFPNS
jgi:phage gp46-like protein